MSKALTRTDFQFKGQKSVYHGKVRDVYNIDDDLMVMVATDRISAFDVILPKGIPFKGQVLNQIAAKFLDATADICPNWKLATPDPMVTVGLKCEGFRVEMIIRGYLTGSAWRDYKNGCRNLCGNILPDGMKENQKFAERLPHRRASSWLTPSMSSASVTVRYILLTRSIPPTAHVTSTPTAIRRNSLRVSPRNSSPRSLYASGSLSITS